MSSSTSAASEAVELDAFEEMIDLLYEKRTASKLHALRGIVQMLSSNLMQQECTERETTLSQTFSRSVRRERDEIPLLAARGFSLLFLTLGMEESSIKVWETVQSDLIPKSLSGKAPVIRAAAVEAYALGCFVVEEDFFKMQSVMTALSQLWSKCHASVATSSIRGWSLILSSFRPSMIASSNFDAELVALRALLESEDSEVQEAAGMAIALLWTFGFGNEGEEESCVGSEDCSDSSSVVTSLSQMDETRDRMKDLSVGKNARKSKKHRASQKAAFRNICSFIEDGTIRETKIKLQYGDVLLLTSLQKHVQMDYMRSILGSGFHRHLHQNPLLHMIFNFRPRNVAETTKMSKSEKRANRSPSSWTNKLRTQTRDWERSTKQLYLQNVVL